MKTRILDQSFKYIPASNTDIRKTFARIRRDLARQKSEAENIIKVEPRGKIAKLRP